MQESTEEVKDNQWWYSKSKLLPAVESSSVIELSINGRSCILERSSDGKDGRETLSFKFIRDDDRAYWRSLNGTKAKIEVVNATASRTQGEDDQEDEYLQSSSDESNIPDDVVLAKPEMSSENVIHKSNSETLFDAYIFIDWSANNVPKLGKDSIWVAEGYWEHEELLWGPEEATCLNAPTREVATKHVKNRLIHHLKEGKRVLVCFDFAYAYPQCAESAAFGSDFAVISAGLSSMISDDARNNSNRFQVASDLNEQVGAESGEGPFWGRPTSGYASEVRRLKTTKPTDWSKRGSLKEFRVVEERLKKRGSKPFSVWQLFGNGSVGSQVLVGLPRVHSLRHDASLSTQSTVWPFETGWVTSFPAGKRIVHAEFWPGAISVDESLHPVRDASQVMSCVAWAASEDALGRLGLFFDPLGRADPEREIAKKEGWILGFTDKKVNE